MLFAASLPCEAQLIVPVSQTRSVTAEASSPNGSPSSNSAAAPDFAPFDRTVYASSGTWTPPARASARQTSAIGADRITVGVNLSAYYDYGGGTARATSVFDVTFDLPDGLDYQLWSSGGGYRPPQMVLSGPEGEITHLSGPGSVTGTLPPGRYRLQSTAIQTEGDDQLTGTTQSSFDFSKYTPPPPPPPGPPSYTFTGKFGSHGVRSIDLPLAGNTPCPSLTAMAGTRMVAVTANPYGCIPGAGRITTTGKGVGGKLVLPKNAFVQPLPASVRWLSPFASANLFQVQTSRAFAGPDQNALLRANAWNAQAGRAAPDFTWSKTAQGPPGAPRVVVKYTAGANRFGGTMKMLMSAGPNPSQIVHNLVGVTFAPLGSTGARPTGAGYAVKETDVNPNGAAFAMYMASSMGRITMGSTYLGPRPGTTLMRYGFPLTTGRVVVRQIGTGPLGSPLTSTISAVGGDAVTSMGARNLSLVAGAVGISKLGIPEIRLAQIALPEPGALAQQLAAVIALLGVAAWRARRHH
jgi:hypothetical protein